MCDTILHCIKKDLNKDDDEKGAVQACRDLAAKIGDKKKDGGVADQWNESVSPCCFFSFFLGHFQFPLTCES